MIKLHVALDWPVGRWAMRLYDGCSLRVGREGGRGGRGGGEKGEEKRRRRGDMTKFR